MELLKLKKALVWIDEHDASIDMEIKVGTVSTANVREHWRTLAKRTKLQRVLTKNQLSLEAGGCNSLDVYCVLLTRIIPQGGRKYDSDNLAKALKPFRDGVADAFKISDGPHGPVWVQDQFKDNESFGVRVRIWLREMA